MNRLLIVGNGFDLHHKMKTTLWNYRNYLMNNGYADIVACREEGSEFDVSELWNDLESALGLLNYESAYCYLLPYNDENWSDSAHHDFQYEVKRMTNYWPGIQMQLAPWIRSIRYTKSDENLFDIVDESSLFMSFNYTNTLEVLYGVPKDGICYIHGDASVTDELVLGHRNDSYYPEWNDGNPDEDIRLLEAGEIMENHRLETMKEIEDIIEKNQDFFELVSDINEVYVIGLSYNEVDRMYLDEIHKRNQRIKWFFNWYSQEDFREIPKYAKRIGICDYERINIDLL